MEIFSDILSYVNQIDCIECMAVSRRWHELVPQYCKDVWTELEISEKSWSKFNNGMLECLGSHVKKLSIISCKNSKILRQLKGEGCEIESLGIKARFQVYDIILDQPILFSGIALFRKTLKELQIKGFCTQYFSLPLLLSFLPTLTHLTIKLKKCDPSYKPSKYDRFMSDQIRLNNHSSYQNNNTIYNLVFVCLESEFRHDFSIKQVLKRCRRLKYLLLSQSTVFDYFNWLPIDISHIHKLCPSIRYVHCGENIIPSDIQKEWFTLSKRGDTNKKNEHDHEKGEACHLHHVEFRDDDEQRHISTLTTCLQQPSLLKHLRLSGSLQVDLYRLWNSFAQHNSTLLSCPSHIKSLELVRFRVLYQTENNISFQGLFSHFQYIERLHMGFFVAPVRNLEIERGYIRKVIEGIGHQLHRLQYLYLDFACCYSGDTKMSLDNNIFTILCDWNQKLEILHLNNVPISNNMLLDLCHHSNLHTLKLSGYELHKQLTKDGLITFARKLKEQEHNNRSGSRIQSLVLSCGYCDDVTDQVLEELARVESLNTLRIGHNKSITDVGVNTFASIKNSSVKSKKIELYSCSLVSLDNPYVTFVE